LKNCNTCDLNKKAQDNPDDIVIQMRKDRECQYCLEDHPVFSKPIVTRTWTEDTYLIKKVGATQYHAKRTCPIVRQNPTDYEEVDADKARSLLRCPYCANVIVNY
jgi:hypothetical protein